MLCGTCFIQGIMTRNTTRSSLPRFTTRIFSRIRVQSAKENFLVVSGILQSGGMYLFYRRAFPNLCHGQTAPDVTDSNGEDRRPQTQLLRNVGSLEKLACFSCTLSNESCRNSHSRYSAESISRQESQVATPSRHSNHLRQWRRAVPTEPAQKSIEYHCTLLRSLTVMPASAAAADKFWGWTPLIISSSHSKPATAISSVTCWTKKQKG